MNRRIAKKKMGQTVGFCSKCGSPIHNCVTPSENGYNGGSCLVCDEDFYRFDIHLYHRRGNPVRLLSKYNKIYEKITR